MIRVLSAILATLTLNSAFSQEFKPSGPGQAGDHVLVVAATSPHHTLDSYLAAARAKPNTMTVGTGTTLGKVGVELLKERTGAPVSLVPYRASIFPANDLRDGFLDSALLHASVAAPLVASGVLREIAVVNLENTADPAKSAL